MEHWVCQVPGCGEQIDAPGPVTLQMNIDAHNREFHAESVGMYPAKWYCDVPGCQEVIERSTQVALQAAIAGHRIYRHNAKVEKTPVYSGLTPEVVAGSSDESGIIKIPYGYTPEDMKWLKDLKIAW